MNWLTVVWALQIVSGFLWLAIAIWLSPSVYSLAFTRRSRDFDPTRTTYFFMGAIQAGFALRWQVWPQTVRSMEMGELQTWCALYALSTLLALWTWLVALTRGRGAYV